MTVTQALLAELRAAGLRAAASTEQGWYYLSLDGRRYWVTKL